MRYCDAFPAVAYSFGIDFNTYSTDFPCIINFPDELPPLSLGLTVDNQIDYIRKHAVRTPKKVLDIGAGRGDVSCVLAKMGIDVFAIEKTEVATEWFAKTGKHFFGNEFIPPLVFDKGMSDIKLDFSIYDTIIMVESIEHIKEHEFNPIWQNIIENFKGLFVLTNFLQMTYIPIGDWGPGAEEEHCRIVTPELYDTMCNHAKKVILREGAHLVLEF